MYLRVRGDVFESGRYFAYDINYELMVNLVFSCFFIYLISSKVDNFTQDFIGKRIYFCRISHVCKLKLDRTAA